MRQPAQCASAEMRRLFRRNNHQKRNRIPYSVAVTHTIHIENVFSAMAPGSKSV